jgi:hypothetical protein
MGEGSDGGSLDPVDGIPDLDFDIHVTEVRDSSPRPFTTTEGNLDERSAIDRLSALGRGEADPGPDLPRVPLLWSLEAADDMRAILDE